MRPMKSTFRVLSAALFIGLFAFCFLVSKSVHAANGLTVSPPLKEITIGPGLLETTSDVTLQNNTDETINAHLQLVDLRALGQFGGASLDKAGLSDKYDLATWMTLPGGDTVIIAKGETVKVKVKITNREDLAPGGHYGAIVITTSGGKSVSSNVNISQQLVSLLFIKKLGGEVFGLDLDPLSYSGSAIPQQLITRFKSTGNVHVIPRGYIEVTDPSGKVVAKGILNQDSNIILPGSTRQFVTLMQPVTATSRPGRYKITAYYRYDGQKDFTSESTYFTHGNTIVPIVISIVLFAGVAMITMLLVLKNKRKRHSRRSK
jgi:hypothetical protein